MIDRSPTLYFLSRFPRFTSADFALTARESQYTLIAQENLLAAIADIDVRLPAPRTSQEFRAAARDDVDAWPRLYVHRFCGIGVAGNVMPAHIAREKAQIVGNIVFVADRLKAGQSLRRYGATSAGGTNAYPVPHPAN